MGFRLFPFALGEEEAALVAYSLLMLCYVAPLRPPILQTEWPAVTAIIISDHDGLIRGCYVHQMQLTTGILFLTICVIGGFVWNQRHVPQ